MYVPASRGFNLLRDISTFVLTYSDDTVYCIPIKLFQQLHKRLNIYCFHGNVSTFVSAPF